MQLALSALAAAGLGPLRARPAAAASAHLAWWSAARYGLFVHWGPYSLAGVEASWPIMEPGLVAPLGTRHAIAEADYVALAERFDPRGFDPEGWIAFARAAGMRYLVITAKHHDGYCLFDAPSRQRYKITSSPYGRDLLAELAEACERAGFPLGFYYSPPDLHHPDYRDTTKPARENWSGEPGRPQWSAYLDAMEADLRHLLTAYGEVAVLWFDGLFETDRYQPERFHRLVRELSPNTLVNDRLGADWGHFVTPEQAIPDGIPVGRRGPAPEITLEQFRAFVRAIEQGISAEQLATMLQASQRSRFPTAEMPLGIDFQPWEACMTLGRTWAWDPEEPEYKSPAAVARVLVEVASRGGNLLLNVGPKPDGTLPEPCTSRLLTVGEWLQRHGEAIYDTTYCSDFGPLAGIAAQGARTTQGVTRSRPVTREDGSVRHVTYVHLLDAIEGSGLRLLAARARVELDGWEARRVGRSADDEPEAGLGIRRSDGHLEIALPPDLAGPDADGMPRVLAVERG